MQSSRDKYIYVADVPNGVHPPTSTTVLSRDNTASEKSLRTPDCVINQGHKNRTNQL